MLATENPIEQEGTYPLPEAQVDRFLFKLRVGYPTIDEERQIMDMNSSTVRHHEPSPEVSTERIFSARKVVDSIYIDDKIKDYILSIVFSTRDPKSYNLDIAPYLRYGASPRASINLSLASRAHAFLQGRAYVTPQDVKSVAADVLRHRVLVSFEAEAEELDSDELITRILAQLPVP